MDNQQPTMLPLDAALSLADDATPTSRVLRVIEGNHVRVSAQLNEYLNRKKSWLSQIWPTRLDRILRDAQLNAAKTEQQLNARILDLACAMKLDACREAADAWTKAMRLETREQFSNFATQRMAALQETVQRERVKFTAHIAGRYAHLATIQNQPVLAAFLKTSVEDEIEAHLRWLDQILIGFRAIVQERVAQYEKSVLPRS